MINVVLVNVLVKAPRPVAETNKVTLVVSLFKTDDGSFTSFTSNWRPMGRATTGGRP